MPLEGLHSRHSGASTADNAPGLCTTSGDYGQAATCLIMDLAADAGARATRMSRLWAGDAAGGRGPERSRATGRDRRPRYCRSGAGRQSGSTGHGVQCTSTRRGMRWVFIILTSSSFFLGESDP